MARKEEMRRGQPTTSSAAHHLGNTMLGATTAGEPVRPAGGGVVADGGDNWAADSPARPRSECAPLRRRARSRVPAREAVDRSPLCTLAAQGTWSVAGRLIDGIADGHIHGALIRKFVVEAGVAGEISQCADDDPGCLAVQAAQPVAGCDLLVELVGCLVPVHMQREASSRKSHCSPSAACRAMTRSRATARLKSL